MFRSKVDKLFYVIENDGFDAARSEILSPENIDALNYLEDSGRVKIHYDINGDIAFVEPLSHHVTYRLERRDIWLNRLWGFLAGVAVTVVATLLLHVVL